MHRPAAGGEVGRQCDVAAESDHHVGVDVVEHGPGLPHGLTHPQRQAHQVAVELARQRNRRDQFEVVAAVGHQPGLQAAGGAQRGDADAGVEGLQRVGDGHGRFDVTRGAATGEHDRHRCVAVLLTAFAARVAAFHTAADPRDTHP